MEQDHKQLALQAEEYNNNHCLLTKLPKEVVTEVFSYCLAYDDLSVDVSVEALAKMEALAKSENQAESFEDCFRNFKRLNSVCKNFNEILTFKTLDSFCRNYALINKNQTLLKLWKNMMAVEEFTKFFKKYNETTAQKLTEQQLT